MHIPPPIIIGKYYKFPTYIRSFSVFLLPPTLTMMHLRMLTTYWTPCHLHPKYYPGYFHVSLARDRSTGWDNLHIVLSVCRPMSLQRCCTHIVPLPQHQNSATGIFWWVCQSLECMKEGGANHHKAATNQLSSTKWHLSPLSQ